MKNVETVVFISNYFNHHQKPFSDAMFERIGDGYLFIETGTMSLERKKLGWGVAQHPKYVVSRECLRENFSEYAKIIDEADVVIVGSAPNDMVKKRIRSNKLTFRYSERFLKNGIELWKYPYRFFRLHKNNPRDKSVYMLCASAYTASDYAKFGLFENRCYKWGYFPETRHYKNVDMLVDNKKITSILWVARFIELKHPEVAIEVARRLKMNGYVFQLNMIGNGTLEEQTKALIADENLGDVVHILGSMKPEEVRTHMEESQIFMFTSDRKEGWGAVLNEAMNSGCAVVANSTIGSVPYLVKDGENGLVYRDGNVDELYEKVLYLLQHKDASARMGKEAYRTITEDWCAELAAERFIRLAERILSGEVRPSVAESGVCSIEK